MMTRRLTVILKTILIETFRDAGAAAAAADDEDEEALPEEEENRPILPYSSFFILSSTNP